MSSPTARFWRKYYQNRPVTSDKVEIVKKFDKHVERVIEKDYIYGNQTVPRRYEYRGPSI